MSSYSARPAARRLIRLLFSAFSLASSFCAPVLLRAAVTRGYVSEARRPVAPGVSHDRGTIETDTAGRQAVHLLEVDVGQPVISFEASLSNDRVAGLERTTAQANRKNEEGHRAVGAINADFWGPLQAPIGMHIEAGELVASGAAARPTFGIEADGDVIIGSPRVTASAIAPNGTSRSIARVNQPRASGQLVLYTARFAAATGTDASGTEVVLTGVTLPISPTGAFSGTVKEVRAGAGNTSIGDEEVVLSGTGAAATFLNDLAPENLVELRFSITIGWEEVTHAVGGGQFIVQGGNVLPAPNDGFSNVTHPRTAIGITPEGDVVMATVDGRQPGYSIGVRLDELGQLMVERGAVTAINLDGGGSTTMAVRLPGEDGVTAVNRGSDGFERAVSNSLLVFSSAPTGPLAIIHVLPPDVTALVGTQVEYTAKGQDASDNAIAIEPGSIKWSESGRAGRIDDSGRFTSLRAGTSTVKAKIERVKGETGVTVVDSLSSLEIRPSYAIVEPGATQSFAAAGSAQDGTPVRIGGAAIVWGTVGPIGTIDPNGLLMAAETPGSGAVTGQAGGETASARVDIGRAPVILEDFEDLSDMRAQAAAATATLTSAMRPDPVRAGTRSARLAYDFTGRPGTSAAYAAHSPFKEIDGRPRRIGVWLYGDGSRHWVRGNFRDGANAQRTVDFTQSPIPTPTDREQCRLRTRGIDWVGWKSIEAAIPQDAVLPLKWERVYVVETVDLCDDASEVFLDDLRAVYGDTDEDTIGPSVTELTPEPGSTTDQATPEIGGTVRDNPGGSGVAPDSIRLTLDGAQVAARYDGETGLVRYTPPEPLASGLHRARLDATDNAGNPAQPFGDWTFTVR